MPEQKNEPRKFPVHDDTNNITEMTELYQKDVNRKKYQKHQNAKARESQKACRVDARYVLFFGRSQSIQRLTLGTGKNLVIEGSLSSWRRQEESKTP